MSQAAAEQDLSHGQRYGDWAAPKQDGALLVWPEPATLADLARDNRRRLDACDVAILGTPVREWREQTRQFLGVPDDQPVVMTGHQSELHHPGVWVKNAVVDGVARQLAGQAWHVAVDTDAPKHLRLRWPGFKAGVTDDPRLHGVAWTGRLDPPTPDHLDKLASRAEEDGLPLVAEYLADVRRYLIEQRDQPSPMTLPGAMLYAQHRLDWSLGLEYSTALASGLFESPAWLALFRHLVGDAGNFARHYNDALADYRREAGITDDQRPMPDLAVEGDRVELPFWLDDLATGVRRRLFVETRGDLRIVGDDLDDVPLPDAPMPLVFALRRHGLRVSSRALSLTLFLRLFASDLFVHGIGGGHYDQVLDRVVRSYLGTAPPGFAVATATLFHPDAVGTERVCLPCLKHWGHQLAHDVLPDDVKARWLDRIAAEPAPKDRRATFDAMHAERRRRLPSDERYQAWQRRMREARERRRVEAVLFSRELFYGVQTRQRLCDLIARVGGAGG